MPPRGDDCLAGVARPKTRGNDHKARAATASGNAKCVK